ncbi:unnamed protein product [Euphydryas editha]|uniref:Uncharacterized protein n=1 Tax=Euphydryas editha TaxID=104508 RepID=A0AAU9TSA0_EUPED|nr:unnamed protein product [Euphydryas editha]
MMLISTKEKLWDLKVTPYLRKYLGMPSSRKISGCESDLKKILSAYLVYNELPRGSLGAADHEACALRAPLSAQGSSAAAALLRGWTLKTVGKWQVISVR